MTDGAVLRQRLRALPVFDADLVPAGFDRAPEDPTDLFVAWLLDAVERGEPEPHAMTVSTVDAAGVPDARVLILEDIDTRGWWFATSASSAKGHQLAQRPAAALTFHWKSVGRQVRPRLRCGPTRVWSHRDGRGTRSWPTRSSSGRPTPGGSTSGCATTARCAPGTGSCCGREPTARRGVQRPAAAVSRRGGGPDREGTGMTTPVDEDARVARLLDAQAKAEQLFAAVDERGVIAPGVTERAASDAIRDLAADMFGVQRFWHKRIVRAGPNTLHPYRENPPDRVIAVDDIAFCDFGPIFEEWEADFGRTYVLGDDPVKHRLRDVLPEVWLAGRQYFREHDEITGAELFDAVVEIAGRAGWEFGGDIAGHLVGEFPHDKIAGDEIGSYIAPGSDQPMRRDDRTGRACHWILEIHLVDRSRGIGGFHEQLLDIGP